MEFNNNFNFISKNLSDTIINIFFLQLSGQGRIVKYKDEIKAGLEFLLSYLCTVS